MKKTLLTGLAVVAVLALASTAGAVTCTVDQHPAATLLVPWFQVSVDSSGHVISTGFGARDTLVTIANASAAPMIAHVNVFNERSELVLDFNIALTGFDVEAFAMSSILTGTLPQTGFFAGSPATLRDACQRNGSALTYSQSPTGIGFIRFRPPAPTDPNDNTLSTTLYPVPAWTASSAFYMQVLDSLDDTFDTNTCPNFNGVDGVLAGLEHGYLVIDHANYCNLSNPSQSAYYSNDAIGNENNLFGDIIFTSGEGLPTYAMSTVNIEADSLFGFNTQSNLTRLRTFYARYWFPTLESAFNPANCVGISPVTNICLAAPWNTGIGDLREPLGLNYAARWFDTSSPLITSNFRVWRAGFGSLTDLLGPVTSTGPKCTDSEPIVSLTFFDEDENTVTQGVCPSPCESPTFNFPLETQQENIGNFSHPAAPAGWVAMTFVNQVGGTAMDQAWVDYSFEGSAAFLSTLVPGTQLDLTSCLPNLVFNPALPTASNPAILVPFPDVPDVPTGTGP